MTPLRRPYFILLTGLFFGGTVMAQAAPVLCRQSVPQTHKAAFDPPASALRLHRLRALRLAQLSLYREDSLQSLALMRGENGLLQDTIWLQTSPDGRIRVQSLNPNVSPTNIAMDLLIQTELRLRGEARPSEPGLEEILLAVAKLKRHEASGLFFSWYGTNPASDVLNANLSSVDNLHLALALWTVQESFPGTKLGDQAKMLFAGMNLSMFFDPTNGLISGNFSYRDGQWNRDPYHYDNLGSEARSLYSAGYALGLFKDQSPSFLTRALGSLQLEILNSGQGPLMKLWDGSAFQMFFPKIFLGEERYSPRLAQMFKASGDHMLAEGKRRGLSTPASHSPGVGRVIKDGEGRVYAIYNDKSGNKDLVSSGNQDVHDPILGREWEATFTPHALFMAATSNPEKILPLFRPLQKMKSGDDAFYRAGLGWMDGIHRGVNDASEVVPAQLALNQGAAVLAILQMQSADGLTASGRALQKNISVRERLKDFYQLFEQKLLQGAGQ